jgi:hypothetical protein
VSTYKDSPIIFYGDRGRDAAELAEGIGYTDVTWLGCSYAAWESVYPELTDANAPGVVSVDAAGGSFIFSGSINSDNHDNVSIWGTHHGVVFKGGALSNNSLIQADIPPFLFQETLTRLGADPGGNMAQGIYYGTPEEYGSKYTNGQRVDFFVSWDSAPRYYSLDELFSEQPGRFDPDPSVFAALGLEPRIGGTRDSNLNWNPGCILCCYSCVCGITSNSRANEETWFSDGGIYEPFTGSAILIKAVVVR